MRLDTTLSYWVAARTVKCRIHGIHGLRTRITDRKTWIAGLTELNAQKNIVQKDTLDCMINMRPMATKSQLDIQKKGEMSGVKLTRFFCL